MRVVGVDVGMDGALWYYNTNSTGVFPEFLDMPTITVTVNKKNKRRLDGYAIRDWLVEVGPVDQVVVEHATSRPAESPVASFTYGEGFGVLQGILIALDRPWSLVRPTVWTKALSVGSDKGVHRMAAQRHFPHAAHLFAPVIKGSGRADAALIALWAARQTKGEVA